MDILSFVIVHKFHVIRMTLCDSRLRAPDSAVASVIPSNSDVRTLLGKIEEVIFDLKSYLESEDTFPAYILSMSKGVGDYCIRPGMKKATPIDRPEYVVVHRWPGTDYPAGRRTAPTERMFDMFDACWEYDLGLPDAGVTHRTGGKFFSQVFLRWRQAHRHSRG